MIKKCCECFYCMKVHAPNKDRYITCKLGNWEDDAVHDAKPRLTYKQFEFQSLNGNIWFNRMARTCPDECFKDYNGKKIIINAKGDKYDKEKGGKTDKRSNSEELSDGAIGVGFNGEGIVFDDDGSI